ncbi:PREDICTED: uncharacterized protein LOC104827233 [Tarenaya hassleriana]|uniref:uncharacterized protein LOC104827233 n=1 Tax=Tarenaya hassleriana TaxID=28532 RepID=UPI00053C18A3|nr:PREDICTED: uncharacterized protein LOC104827233 [Tarenaya hassleriana]
MGNYASCSLSKNSSSSSPSAKVILPDGEVHEVYAPTKAAEIMMEIPNHFLVDAKALKIGRKLSPLPADEDLDLRRGCRVYVVFPMRRASSAANSSDMARLFLAAGKKRRRGGSGGVRVSPGGEDDDVRLVFPARKLSLEDIEEVSAAEFMHRMSVSKSKKPQLETIAEESVSST